MAGKGALAYVVTEDCEGTGGVVFAKSNGQARREGACEFGDGDFHAYTARRAPEFDCFAERGDVPGTVLIERGWWFECACCGARISQDEIDNPEEGEEPMNPVDGKHSFEVFCRPSCMERERAEQMMRARLRDDTIARLRAELLAKMPGAQIVESGSMFDNHVYARQDEELGWWTVQQGIVAFRFPGCLIGPAHYRFDTSRKGEEAPHVTVCGGDKAAFDAWRDAGYPPTPSSGGAE